MSDEPDDGSDWLSSQFNPTEQVPKQTPPVVPPPAAEEPPVVQPPPAAPPRAATPFVPPAAAPTAAPPAASAPAPTANGGFNWALRPGSAVEPPATPAAVVPPVPLPAAPVPPAPVAAVPTPTPAPTAATPPPLVMPPSESHAPPSSTSEPTQPLNWDDFAATQQQASPSQTVQPTTPLPPVADPLDQPTEAYTVLPWEPAAGTSADALAEDPVDPADPTSAIDSLFSGHKFEEYEEVGVLKTLQALPTGANEPVVREPRAPLPTNQKALMGVAGGLIGVLILIGLFFLGQHLGTAQAAAPIPSNTPGATPVPTPAGTGGPATPGVQQWTALQGGECIQSFSSAWAQTFTVVGCTADHGAEMVFKGKLPDTSAVAYPTAAAFKKELTPLCSAPTAINYTAAAAVTDLQVSFSYPPNTAAWLSGDRTYYCFVNRASGSNLTGDLAVAKTAAGS